MNERARVCMVSQRGVNRQAAWCANYEFEDVACEVDRVDLFCLERGALFDSRRRLVRSLIWRPLLRELTPHVNPGAKPIVLRQDYDLFVYVCMNPADLIYLAAVAGWKDRCRKSVCVLVEFYKPLLEDYRFHLGLLRHFDHVVFCQVGATPAAESLLGKTVHHVPFGVDVLKFSPLGTKGTRPIDVFSIGRRVEALHEALRRMAARGDLFYLYDTLAADLAARSDHRQHREAFAHCAKRSRYFVAFPAKVDVPDETRGESEVGARFFEGAAAGTVMIGRAPTVASFARDFSWADAVVELGSTEESLKAALDRLQKDPGYVRWLGHHNAVEAARRFDWAYRWRAILEIAGLEPMPELTHRETHLAELLAKDEARTSIPG